jgi:hypothetical protein
MGKDDNIQSYTPKSTADRAFNAIQNKLLEKIPKLILDYLPEEDRQFSWFYLNAPPEIPNHSLDKFIWYPKIHQILVVRSVPWGKIKRSLQEFRFDEKTIKAIVYILKPIPIEKVLFPNNSLGQSAIKDFEKRFCGDLAKDIKRLSPLIKQLENLYQISPQLRSSLPPAIDSLKKERETYRELIKLFKDREKKLYRSFKIDKDLKKSPQKHRYWNVTTSGAINILNQYCHHGGCDKNCRKTHEKAIRTVAKLLKILYPMVWKENISTIANRIKQKDYRHLSR